MTAPELAAVLRQMGCPPANCVWLAEQLLRRAQMDAARQQITPDAALEHLLRLMAQGWVARR